MTKRRSPPRSKSRPALFFRDAALAKALQAGNDRRAADAALNNLLDKGASWDPYDVAQIYAMRNDADKTFEWLDRSWSYRDPAVHNLPYDPFIRRYKDDPRFTAFCRKLGCRCRRKLLAMGSDARREERRGSTS